ncbi:hypothetical protein LTR85_004029 [Meristemomyces frigidus]|nr:hypothetical protein LTR85_004029 [Meristemomyces frigidus]
MANKPTADQSTTQSGRSRAASPVTTRSDTSSNSKASSPSEAPKNQIDFQFLNFSHPSDAKASRARRTVRSHVTRRQHAQETALQATRKAQSFHDTSAEPEQPPATLRKHAVTLPSHRPTTLELASSSSTSAPITSSPETSSASPSPTTSPDQPSICRIDPSEVYPEEWHPYIPRVMEHYLSNLAVDIPDLDGPVTKGLLRTRFFPLIMTDAAPLHAVMLVAASHYSKVRGSRLHAIDLLQLRGMAIREINAALEDGRRATSDQLIAAVAKMASYEALFGDRDIFNTHMTGLTRMVTLRGGLPNLGLDGLLERILLWIDANATLIVGRHLYFDKNAFPTTAVHPRPDPQRFAGGIVRQP